MSDRRRRFAIVVRKRTVEETRNLAFLTIGREWRALAPLYAALAIPVFLLDSFFWGACWSGDFPPFFDEPIKSGDVAALVGLAFVVWATVAFEGAFVGSLATRFLGFWLFRPGEKIGFREVVVDWVSSLSQTVYYLVLTRVFRTRPFYAETILLEKTPFWKKRDGRPSTRERVAAIVRGAPESFGESVANAFWSINAAVAGYFVVNSVGGAVISESRLWFPTANLIAFPIFCFGVEFYFVVYRFLRYIDYRVEKEGWDVDLAFRAESEKIFARLDAEGRGVDGKGGIGGNDRARVLRASAFSLDFDDEPATGGESGAESGKETAE